MAYFSAVPWFADIGVTEGSVVEGFWIHVPNGEKEVGVKGTTGTDIGRNLGWE